MKLILLSLLISVSANLLANGLKSKFIRDCESDSSYISFKNLNPKKIYSVKLYKNKKSLDEVNLTHEQSEFPLEYYGLQKGDQLNIKVQELGHQKILLNKGTKIKDCHSKTRYKTCSAFIPENFPQLIQYCMDKNLYEKKPKVLKHCSYMANNKIEFNLCIKNDIKQACSYFASNKMVQQTCLKRKIPVYFQLNCKELPTDSEINHCLQEYNPKSL
jgi:hypothetical protein